MKSNHHNNTHQTPVTIRFKSSACFFGLCISLSANVCAKTEFIKPTLADVLPPDSKIEYGWQEKANHLCGGTYQHPLWDRTINESPALEVTADHIHIVKAGESRLQGKVRLTLGQRAFYANDVGLFRENQEILKVHTNSPLLYTDPDLMLSARQAAWIPRIDMLEVQDLEYVYFPKHARGQAQNAQLKNNNTFTLTRGSYTTCAPDNEDWRLEGEQLTLNKEKGIGTAKNMILRVKDVPILYWPYLQFPIDDRRKSGFLFPHMGSTSQSGLEYSQPYYWNIAPNYDATFTPRLLSERGVELQNEFRYLFRQGFGTAKVHFLPNDTKYRTFRRQNRLSPPIQAPFYDPRLTALDHGNHRLGVHYNHQNVFSKTWRLHVDYTYVSDDNYFYDLENALNSASTTKLNQELSLHFNNMHWEHVWRVQRYHLLHPLLGPVNQEDYRRMPQWAFYGHYPKLAKHLAVDLEGEWVRYTHPLDPYTGLFQTQGHRYHLRPGIMMPFESWFGFFKPRVQFDYLGYRLDLSQQDRENDYPNSPDRIIPIYSLDTGLYFDKFYDNGYQQTLEPRAYYLYVPYRDQSAYPNFDTTRIDFGFYRLFRNNRFTGRDRLNDAHQLTLALTSRILNKSAEEKLRLTVGEIIYFKDRRVTLCAPNDMRCLNQYHPDRHKSLSPLIGNITYTPAPALMFATGLEFNPNHAQVDKAYLSAQYAPAANKILNVNYYWMRRDPLEETSLYDDFSLHQVDASIMWPLHRKWHLIAQHRHDFERDRRIQSMFGIEYNDCCFGFQIVGNRYLRPNDGLRAPDYANGIFFQFLLKGLSSIGANSANDHLTKAIPGYQSFTQRSDF